MPDIKDRFISAVRKAHEQTKTGGVRSNKRIKALHGWIKNEIADLLGPDYIVCGQSNDTNSEEEKVEGWYYTKKVDVAVKRGGVVIGVVSVKLINSNYKQNANNYFENQMGETANLRRKNIVFGNIFCVPQPIPYKAKDGGKTKEEHIRGSDICKYKKLEKDHVHLHSPDIQALVVIKLNACNKVERICTKADLDHLSECEYRALESMGIKRFFRVFTKSIESKWEFLSDE